jgi:ABC-2 type transport system permease protein
VSPIAQDITAIGALAKREAIRFFRDRSQVLGAFGRPIIWMVLFGSGLRHAFSTELGAGVDFRQYSYAGAIAMTILFAGMFQGVTIVWDREFGMLRAVLVAPISRGAIVIGKTLAASLVTFMQALVSAAFAPLIDVSYGALQLVALLGAMAVLSIAISALGVMLGSRMKTLEGFGVMANFVILPLYFLSGGVFPPSGMPSWMRALAMLNPVTYGVDLMRACIGHPHAFGWQLDAGVLLAFAAAMCAGALFSFRRASH